MIKAVEHCFLRANTHGIFLMWSCFLATIVFESNLLSNDNQLAKESKPVVVVVIPDTWRAALQTWKTFRENQAYQVEVVAPAATAEETRNAIRSLLEKTGKTADFILLAADAPDFQETKTSTITPIRIPTFYVESKVVVNFGSAPTIATDYPYSDWKGDGVFRAAVGRIPASSANDLAQYLDRVIHYESNQETGPWQKRLDIVAGVGGFGVITDTVVESMTRQLLTEDIPNEYRLSMMQASPSSVYYPNPLLFRQTAIDRFNQGGLFWIYLGHGFVDTLDYLPYQDRLLPIFTQEDLPKIQSTSSPPIAVFLACYLGAFDAMGGCLAERMVMQPGGSIASIAGSRVTMPYGMGILGIGMIEASLRDRLATLGEIVHRAKIAAAEHSPKVDIQKQTDAPKQNPIANRREFLDTLARSLSPTEHSIEDERIEHNVLFNLLGDPLLHISYPEPIEFDAPEIVQCGDRFSIEGFSPVSGIGEVEICYKRQRIPDEAKRIRSVLKHSKSLDDQQLLFEAANSTTILKASLPNITGKFQIQLPSTDLPPGEHILQVTIYGKNEWATGTRSIQFKAASRNER